jgi:hypothetical protein
MGGRDQITTGSLGGAPFFESETADAGGRFFPGGGDFILKFRLIIIPSIKKPII